MSITDELREWADQFSHVWIERDGTLMYSTNGRPPSDYSMSIKFFVWELADRIDAAHRAALEKLAAQMDETSGMREFCERLDRAANNREDVTIWGVDYTPLPVDADGLPIHVGDVMEVKFDTKRKPFTVSFVGERAVAFWVVGQPELKSFNLDTVLVTHHHAPTVEDVLREFSCVLMGKREFDGDVTEAIAEFAAKLRLAGEGE